MAGEAGKIVHDDVTPQGAHVVRQRPGGERDGDERRRRGSESQTFFFVGPSRTRRAAPRNCALPCSGGPRSDSSTSARPGPRLRRARPNTRRDRIKPVGHAAKLHIRVRPTRRSPRRFEPLGSPSNPPKIRTRRLPCRETGYMYGRVSRAARAGEVRSLRPPPIPRASPPTPSRPGSNPGPPASTPPTPKPSPRDASPPPSNTAGIERRRTGSTSVVRTMSTSAATRRRRRRVGSAAIATSSTFSRAFPSQAPNSPAVPRGRARARRPRCAPSGT